MAGQIKQYLGLESPFSDEKTAAVVIIPFPYEGGVSFGNGAAKAPQAVIDASAYLELYDEVLKAEPYRVGITTIGPPDVPAQPPAMVQCLFDTALPFVKDGKCVVCIGGDHSISTGLYLALREKHKNLSVIQIDAHADLRDSYEGSPQSHACVMARIRESCTNTVQFGIRSMSVEEARLVERENIALCTMHDYRNKTFPLDKAIDQLPDPVFLTLDVDVFDSSVIFSTGTPEPGGFSWDEGLTLLEKIFTKKNVAGFDVVELAPSPSDRNSPFAVAKLIYKMIGFKFRKELTNR